MAARRAEVTTKRARARPEKGERPALTARQQADRQRRYAALRRPTRSERTESADDREHRLFDRAVDLKPLAAALGYPLKGNAGPLQRANHGKRGR